MATRPTLLLLVASLLPGVAAHGFVHKLWLGTTNYVGNIPQADPAPSIIRQISTTDPVKGASNPFLACGQNAQLAADVGSVSPGDRLGWLWQGGDLSRWPHNTGPMLTYMAECGEGGDCTRFNASGARWFKIAEVGREDNGTGDWFQARIYAADNIYANATLPATLAPGNYLLRHEIIALHLATEMGGAEFYPSCAQVTVGGDGTGRPTDAELVSLPGAYSDDDPGIYVPSVYDTPPEPYVFPGPPVAAFVGASSDGGGSTTGASATGTGSASQPTGTGPASTGTTCKLKRVPPASPVSVTAAKRHLPSRRHAHKTFSARHILHDLSLTFPSLSLKSTPETH